MWFIAKSSKMKADYWYTPESVFDTFPWPQGPSAKQVDAVVEVGREIRRIRSSFMQAAEGGLRVLYRTLDLPGKNPLKEAHDVLDAAVFDAYGFSAKKDVLGQLLTLNQSIAALAVAGKTLQGPGVPSGYVTPAKLVTNDCFGL